MKTIPKGIFNDFFNTVVWILMTLFSIIKETLIFILHLFFYNNVSITPDEISDEITISSKNGSFSESKYSNTNINNLTIDGYQNNSTIDTYSNDNVTNDNATNSNNEYEINEEEERERVKEELKKEDEEDSEIAKILGHSKSYENGNENNSNAGSSILIPKEKENRINHSSGKIDSETNQIDDSEEDDEYSLDIQDENIKINNPQMSIKKDELKISHEENVIKSKSISNLSHSSKKIFPPEFLEKRRSAINNLIDSEVEYRRYLNVLIDVYRAKINGIIDKETNDLIFGNIKPLIVVSEQFGNIFYDELKKGPKKAEIAKCFTNLPLVTQQFISFMLNYKKSISIYKRLLLTNIRFMLIIKKIESSSSSIKFTHIYSLPLKRFTDYINLLKIILRVTPQWHEDYQDIPKVILLLRETDQNIEKQCKNNANEIKLNALQHQIIDCPILASPGRHYIRSFKLFDWKKLYIFNDLLLITRGKRLRKKVDTKNIRSIWLDSNTGTVHLRVPNKKDIRIRGALKGNEIYTIIKTQLNNKTSDGGSPPPQTSSHETYLYRRSDLVRPPSPSRLSSFDESSINTGIDSNSFANSCFSTSNNETSMREKSVFLPPKDSDVDLSDEVDSYSDSDNSSEMQNVSGTIENSESIKSNDNNNDDEHTNSTTKTQSSSNDDETEEFPEQMLNDRKAAIYELIESETHYQQNLQSIVNLYKHKFSKSIVNEKTEQGVFGNVSSLIVLSDQTNLTLQEEIKRGIEKAEIWKCYSTAPQYIKFYHTYMSNYTSMLSHYNDFVISDKKIKKFVKKIEDEDPQHRFTTLSVMPFVRITTLIKQLQTIFNSTPDWHTDHINLPDIISDLSSISNDSTKMCAQAENLNQLIQIETSIIDCPSLFSKNRNFLKAFMLNDKSNIYVMNDIIVFARPNKKLKYCLNFAEIKKIANKLNSVSLTMNDGKTHSIKSNDQTQRIYDFLKEQKAKQVVSA